MRRLVGDLEANGLLFEADKVWCGVFIDIDTEEVFKFRPDQLDAMVDFLKQSKMLAMHNGIMYDKPLMKKVLGYEYQGKLVDTWVMSQLLFPEYFQHGVDAWGQRLGRAKPKHEDWSQFSEEMMHRCTEDTFIQLDIYKACLKKMGWFKSKGIPFNKKTFDMTFSYFEILALQQQSGWQFDKDRAIELVDHLTSRIDLIDMVLKSGLPIVYDTVGTGEVKKPFLKSGKYAAITLRWYPDAEDTKVVGGQFSRVEYRLLDLSKQAETKEFLLEQGWQPKEWNYNKEGVRTSPKLNGNDPFIGINGKVGRLIAKRLQCVQRRSIIQGWINKVRDNGRLSQEINGLADTRRLKHSVLVNVPSPEAFFGGRMRKLFISRDGYKLVGTDASGCQDRMLLARGKKYGFDDPKFEHMLLHGSSSEGTDSHTQARDAINIALRKHNLPEIIRKSAKNFNFAYKFAAGDYKLGSMAKAPTNKEQKVGGDVRIEMNKLFSVQFQTSEHLKEIWRKTCTTQFNAKREKMEKMGGYVPSLDGSPIRVNIEKDCLVYTLQSDEAITMQVATLFFHKWVTEDLGWTYGNEWCYVGVAHDEASLEVRDDLAEKARDLFEKAINHASKYFGLEVEQIGEGKIGNDWYEIH